MTTIHTPWTAAHDTWDDLDVSGYMLAAPARITDAGGDVWAVWSGDGITEAHALAVGARWDAEPLVLPEPILDVAPSALTADERLDAVRAALVQLDDIAAPVLSVDVLDILLDVRTAVEGS